MPYNGSGQYSAPANSWNPAVGGATISSADWNSTQSDYETALSNVICKDGQTTITANLPMADFKHTGVNTNSGSTSRSEYASGATLQDGGTLDAGITSGTSTAYTATLTPAITAYATKQCFRVQFDQACGASPTISFNSVGARKIYKNVGGTATVLAADDVPANFIAILRYDATLDSATGGFWILNLSALGAQNSVTFAEGAAPSTPATDRVVLYALASGALYSKDDTGAEAAVSMSVPVRQTVLSGPVDSNGLAAFGGSTGSATLTMSGTLVVTAANGFNKFGSVNLTGSGTNLQWTGLSTNGTMYLYVDVGADGVLTPGAGTLVPAYQWGGTYSTTSGQFTFNIQEMVGKVGNGSAAAQAYRVYVGEVTIAGNVVTAITWYQLLGRYTGPWVATLPGTSAVISQNHNLGVMPADSRLQLLNTTNDNGYVVGQIVNGAMTTENNGPYAFAIQPFNTRLAVSAPTGNRAGVLLISGGGGGGASLTAASWSYRFIANRNW